MFKKIMLAGVAASALAFAGQASALEFDSTFISGQAVTDGAGPPTTQGGSPTVTAVDPYAVATERTIENTGAFIANSFAARAVLTQGNLGSGQYLVDFTLDGPADFARLPLSTDLAPSFAGLQCTAANFTSSVQSRTSTSVTFFVTVSNCDDAENEGLTGLTLQGANLLRLTTAATATSVVGITVGIRSDGGNTQLDGATNRQILITRENGYQIVIDRDLEDFNDGDTRINLQSDPIFTALEGGPLIGRFAVNSNTDVFSDLDGTSIDSLTGETVSLRIETDRGDLNLVKPFLSSGSCSSGSGSTGTFSTGTMAQTAGPLSNLVGAGFCNIGVFDNGTSEQQLLAIDPELTVTVSAPSGFTSSQFTISSAQDVPLEIVQREGTVVVVPWVNSQQGTSTQQQNVIRLSRLIETTSDETNTDVGADLSRGPNAGRVFVEVVGGPREILGRTRPIEDLITRPAALVNPEGNTSFDVNNEIDLRSIDLRPLVANYTGTDQNVGGSYAGRFDIRLIIEGDAQNITAKMFRLNTATGAITEQSLQTVYDDQPLTSLFDGVFGGGSGVILPATN